MLLLLGMRGKKYILSLKYICLYTLPPDSLPGEKTLGRERKKFLSLVFFYSHLWVGILQPQFLKYQPRALKNVCKPSASTRDDQKPAKFHPLEKRDWHLVKIVSKRERLRGFSDGSSEVYEGRYKSNYKENDRHLLVGLAHRRRNATKTSTPAPGYQTTPAAETNGDCAPQHQRRIEKAVVRRRRSG